MFCATETRKASAHTHTHRIKHKVFENTLRWQRTREYNGRFPMVHVRVYIYIYICLCVYVYDMYMCMYIYIYTCINMYIYIYIYRCAFVYRTLAVLISKLPYVGLFLRHHGCVHDHALHATPKKIRRHSAIGRARQD